MNVLMRLLLASFLRVIGLTLMLVVGFHFAAVWSWSPHDWVAGMYGS